jgi:hypothetical protein
MRGTVFEAKNLVRLSVQFGPLQIHEELLDEPSGGEAVGVLGENQADLRIEAEVHEDTRILLLHSEIMKTKLCTLNLVKNSKFVSL